MIYGSVCSGIEAATVAWHPLGWKPAFFAEVASFPSAVLRHHYDTPNHGDFTNIIGDEYGAIDALVGGTPCQDFSVAGLRAGLDGARGQLTVEYAHLAHRLASLAGTRWLVWENVPGVLSIDSGRAFALFLGTLAKRTVRVPDGVWQNSGIVVAGDGGFGLAYRVLDAQHFGVPQRRRRVFVVGYFGDWRRAAAVLFERYSMSGNTPPRRQARKSSTVDVVPRLRGRGNSSHRLDIEAYVAAEPVGIDGGDLGFALRAGASHSGDKGDGGVNCTLVAQQWPAEVAPTLDTHYGDKMGLEDQHIRGGGAYLSRSYSEVGKRDGRPKRRRVPESHCDGGVFDDAAARGFL